MKKGPLLASLVLFSTAGLHTASASLVLETFEQFSGTGLGAVATLLTIQATGTETGCVSPTGIGDTMTATGTCTGSGADVKTGASQTQTQMLGSVGITGAANFAVILNASQISGGPITLDNTVVAFYNSGGTKLYETSGLTCVASSGGTPTPAPCNIASTEGGIGQSGYLITLDSTQATAAAAAGAFSSSSNIVGISGSLSNTNDGQETFFLANTGAVAPVPEPAVSLLLGSGLVGLSLLGSKLRRKK